MSTKLNEDQIAKFKELKQKNEQLSFELGQITRQQWAIEALLEQGKKAIEEHVKEENEFMKSLEEEYGTGSVNLETYEFTPSEKEDNQ